MPTHDADWLADPRVEHLFQQFPLSLALASHDGTHVVVNVRFSERFDRVALASEPFRRMLASPTPAWETLAIAQRDGTAQRVHAQSLAVAGGTMLIIDESPGEVRSDEIVALRARIVELERESATDRLTGAWNRAHLDRVIEAELARSAHFQLPLTIVLIDIDHFKRVNDTHGHQAGDAVLRELVAVVRAKTRAADLLFRWGGEEFVVLASSCGHRAAEKVAELLRAAVAAHTFPAVGALTISVGVAEHLVDESAAVWFGRADAMLYAAKSGGRDRVNVDRRGSSDTWAEAHGQSALRLEWREAYESGDATIDDQHRTLFELANVLIDASVDPRTTFDATLAALDRVIAHVILHFADEEALLEQRGYAHLAGHQRAHAGLILRAGNLRQDLVTGTAKLGDVVEFLAGQVVARHLLTADRDFFPLFARGA